MSQVLDNLVNPNDYNFAEKKLLSNDGPVEILVTNNTTRTMKFGETVFLNGYIGEVMETDGILATEDGLININPDRHISMNQVDVADTFAAQKNPIFFLTQTNSDPGEWKDTDVTGLILFKAEVIGSAPAATPAYIEYKPPYQNGDLVATT